MPAWTSGPESNSLVVVTKHLHKLGDEVGADDGVDGRVTLLGQLLAGRLHGSELQLTIHGADPGHNLLHGHLNNGLDVLNLPAGN